MKIAFLIQDITTTGGTERTTCCLANEMIRQGDEVSVVSVFHEAEAPRYALDERVRLVFISDEHYGLDLSMAARLRLIRKQVTALRHCAVLDQAEVVLSQKLLASVLAEKAGLEHKTFACEHYKYGMYNFVVRAWRNRLYRGFRGLVTLTENDRLAFLAHGVRHVHVVENMVSIRPIPYEGALSQRILAVGRLDKQKGFDLLLEAVSLMDRNVLDGWHFDVFGDGSEREALLRQRNRLALDEIISFHPFVKEIEREYATHAFLVMSSRFEGFPMVLLEAAAAGLPIVSFDCKEGPATLLRNGGGLLVKAEDTEALAEALTRMMTDSALREQCARETTEVVAPYTPEAIYRKWMKLFKETK